MTKQEKQTIDREFRNYKANAHAAATCIADMTYNGFAVDYSRLRVKSSTGNSVERSVVNAISKEERAYGWSKVFEKTLDKYRWEQKDKLMIAKYIQRRPRWRIISDLALSEKTYHRWLDDILYTGYMWAKEFSLI